MKITSKSLPKETIDRNREVDWAVLKKPASHMIFTRYDRAELNNTVILKKTLLISKSNAFWFIFNQVSKWF
jgi:hypothetical protein